MIVAVILADKNAPLADTYFAAAESGEGSVLERTAATVLRGPFGGTLVAAQPALHGRVKSALSGFAVQFVDVPATAQMGPAVVLAGLTAAAAFRSRWEKAMAAANARFEKKDPDGSPGDWAKHKQHADVKVRGLARSFDRDGVLLVPADAPLLKPETLATAVERFARDASKKAVQIVRDGVRDWPAVLTLDAASELGASGLDVQAWLLAHVETVLDVNV
jgi:CTP:molybdopterin cytidylyltransferase MocA